MTEVMSSKLYMWIKQITKQKNKAKTHKNKKTNNNKTLLKTNNNNFKTLPLPSTG